MIKGIQHAGFLCVQLILSSGLFAADISFSRQILPILSDRCFQCHGPDEANREADLRLDLEATAKQLSNDQAAIYPANLSKSLLWERITTTDGSISMPPPDSHREPLSPAEIELVRRWISEGAVWGKHWAFEPISRPEITSQAGSEIDYFITENLTQQRLSASEPANLHTQLRRLSFTLRGVAPSESEMQAFEAQPTDGQWANLVESFLESDQHAERLAMWWLDAARYSDSDGYQADKTRQNWPWRDWVVDAFHSNMPFDQFTIEQFAGDLLPEATQEQILATCFHRNHMTNGEGGRDPEESRIDYVLDRTNTMGTLWMGLTLGCSQCHDHKFDPVSQRDYYSLTAFFNSIDEDGKAGTGAKPSLKYKSRLVAERVAEMERFVSQCQQVESESKSITHRSFIDWVEDLKNNPPDPYQAWRVPKVLSVESNEGTEFATESDGTIQTSGPTPNQDDYRIELEVPEGMHRLSGWRIEVLPHRSHIEEKFTRQGKGDFILTNVKVLVNQRDRPSELELEIASAKADYEAKKDRKTDWDTRYSNIKETLNDDARDGWTTEGAEEVKPHIGVYRLAEPYTVKAGDRFVIILKQRSTQGDANLGRFRISLSSEAGETVERTDSGSPIQEFITLNPEHLDEVPEELMTRLEKQHALDSIDYQMVKQKLDIARRQLSQIRGQAEARSVMVLGERKEPRPTHVLVRGVWDAKGKEVQRGFLPSITGEPPVREKKTNEKADAEIPEEESLNRLDLANWLVSPENPLTARVIANHAWQLMFGTGLVATSEDFGLQGQLPSHPALLDWLASELIDSGWDLRHLFRLIASSKTFRQSSQGSEESMELDPDNRLLARGPRYRLPAWMLRDNALSISGLLNPALGGPPVFPYQPKGIWSEITMGRFQYEPSLGPEQYRRTLYAFWRRSSSPAFLFDSAERRVCEVRVSETNTPLHALTLMNDRTYLECARSLADVMVQESDFHASLNLLGRRVLSRDWEDLEVGNLQQVHQKALDYYGENPTEAAIYTKIGQRDEVPAELVAQTAAWMTCASLVMNLDEAITLE